MPAARVGASRFEADVARVARARPAGPERSGSPRWLEEVDGLVVSKLDRLSRSVADFAALLERSGRRGGASILDLGIDTTTIMGEAMATMAATFAQVERRRIGSAPARRSPCGGRRASSSAVVRRTRWSRRIRRQRASGRTLAGIAAQLNADGVPTAQGGRQWWPATVRDVLAGLRMT